MLEVPDCQDRCPTDPLKTLPGDCGCHNADTDADFDGVPHCRDQCDNDYYKIDPGKCGCGESEYDRDFDGTPDCNDRPCRWSRAFPTLFVVVLTGCAHGACAGRTV